MLGTLLLGTAAAAAVRGDPWPTSPVITRLFALPSSRADAARLARDLDLTAAQVQGLRHLQAGEARSAELGKAVQSRLAAQQLNLKIAAMQAEKDRKARLILGDSYPAFRQWLREWWSRLVELSRQNQSAPVLKKPVPKKLAPR